METILIVVHILASAALIGLVLLQQGKGAEMGAAFGAGASATVFGSRGSGSFLSRGTAILATVFFLTSLSLAYLSGRTSEPSSVTEMVVPAAVEQPVEDMPAAPAADDIPAAPKAGEEQTQ